MTSFNTGQRILEELPSEELRLLQERAREFAKSTVRDASEGETCEMLEVSSRGQVYAIPVEAIEGVAELTSIAYLPLAPSFVRGLISFRGRAMIAVEISGMLGESQTGFADLKRTISLTSPAGTVCVLAERVMTVRTAKLSDFIADPTSSAPFVVGTSTEMVSLIRTASFVEFVFNALGALDDV